MLARRWNSVLHYLLSRSTHQSDYPDTFVDDVGERQSSFDVDIGRRVSVKVESERIVHA